MILVLVSTGGDGVILSTYCQRFYFVIVNQFEEGWAGGLKHRGNTK